MYNKQIDFDYAKKLKVVGFNYPTNWAYVDVDISNNYDIINKETLNDNIILIEYTNPQNHNDKTHRASVPTMPQIHNWFVNEKDYVVAPYYNEVNNEYYIEFIHNNKIHNLTFNTYKTYYEALIDGLKFLIDLFHDN